LINSEWGGAAGSVAITKTPVFNMTSSSPDGVGEGFTLNPKVGLQAINRQGINKILKKSQKRTVFGRPPNHFQKNHVFLMNDTLHKMKIRGFSVPEMVIRNGDKKTIIGSIVDISD
jgi:hypothetical protein